jgi:alpha-glucosidase (family GH31 glycosyl hydrolase)
MSNSITDIMQQNIFGVTMSGANICGYHGDTTPELCARWYKIGAFYPLAVNHNVRGARSQAPYDFSADIMAEIQEAMAMRYSLLRYLNTRLWRHSLWSDDGGTFFKPLFFEFPDDDGAYEDMSLNVMWGPSIKLSLQSDTDIHGRNWNFYYPKGVWCDIFNVTQPCLNMTTSG